MIYYQLFSNSIHTAYVIFILVNYFTICIIKCPSTTLNHSLWPHRTQHRGTSWLGSIVGHPDMHEHPLTPKVIEYVHWSTIPPKISFVCHLNIENKPVSSMNPCQIPYRQTCKHKRDSLSNINTLRKSVTEESICKTHIFENISVDLMRLGNVTKTLHWSLHQDWVLIL